PSLTRTRRAFPCATTARDASHAKKNFRFPPRWVISRSMNFDLKNKWLIITGASSGFGAGAARAFGAEGSRLLLGARRVDRLETIAAEARKAGAAEAHFHALDVGKTDSVEKFVAWARAKIGGGKLHVLINNAGGALGLDTVAE